MRRYFCKLQVLLNRICVVCVFFLYRNTRKVSPSAISSVHVNNWLLWELQSWKFTASVFWFGWGFFVCLFGVFFWSGLASCVSSCEKSGCSSCLWFFRDTWNCFRVSVLPLKFLREWITCSLIKGEDAWILTWSCNTQQFSWPSSRIH